mmetsp:Transcript_16331/g.28222  ORF Transcript_16331/g.28222 Transcript_16331/m.28222 type:complete len:80 (+) Transcript_16331:373-612(+)
MFFCKLLAGFRGNLPVRMEVRLGTNESHKSVIGSQCKNITEQRRKLALETPLSIRKIVKDEYCVRHGNTILKNGALSTG